MTYFSVKFVHHPEVGFFCFSLLSLLSLSPLPPFASKAEPLFLKFRPWITTWKSRRNSNIHVKLRFVYYHPDESLFLVLLLLKEINAGHRPKMD